MLRYIDIGYIAFNRIYCVTENPHSTESIANLYLFVIDFLCKIFIGTLLNLMIYIVVNDDI